MDSFGLPMSFGKKVKAAPVNMTSKVDKTKRDDGAASYLPGPSINPRPHSPDPGPSAPSLDQSRSTREEDADEDEDDIGPMPPPPPTNGSKRKAEEGGEGEDDDSDSGFEDDGEEEVDRTPITHEIVLKDHTKVVSALAVDPSGARFATGSHDYDTKLWDFGGMDSRLKPFKSWEANGNYHVHDLDYSPDGQYLLVISGTFYPKVFNREGDDEIEFNKGDVYLRDMRNTKGHTAEINGGKWHPTSKTDFLTCSNDSTLRIWDVTKKREQKQVIVVKSKERGARTRVTACAWSHDGKMIAGACLDGTLHVWNTNSNLARPNYSCETAHKKGTETTSVVFTRDGRHLVSRGGDGDNTIKLWDIRSMRKPIAVAENIGNIYSEANLVFSPDDRSILAGLPAPKGQKGAIVFLDSETLVEQRRVAVAEGTVVRVAWHSRINQIFATLSTGAVHVLYSPHSSIHGALLPLAKMPRTAPRDPSFSSADIKPVIYTPDALPMYADEKYGESLHQREKRSKRYKPTEPVSGVGKGGRLGASATQGFVQTVFTNRLGKEDPREALLKYADKKDDEGK